MSDQHALPTLKQLITKLETILTSTSALPQDSHTLAPAASDSIPQAPKGKPNPNPPSIIAQKQADLAFRKVLEAEEASRRASLSGLIDTCIEQTEALLTWPKTPKTGRPSGFDTAFRDLYELKEEQERRLEEYERRARVLKMKLGVVKITVQAVGREIQGLRGCVEGMGEEGRSGPKWGGEDGGVNAV